MNHRQVFLNVGNAEQCISTWAILNHLNVLEQLRGFGTKPTFTLPAVVADTQLLPSEVAVAMVGATAVVPAVGDIAGLAFPVLVTFTVHSAGDRVPRGALPVARAVIGTRVDPGEKDVFIYPTLHAYI